MPRFLSDAWFAALDGPAVGDVEARLRIHQVVTGGPDGDVEYGVVVTDDAAVITADPSPDADIRVVTDYATASAIHQGQLAVDDALSRGLVRITGDTARLVAAGPALGAAAGSQPRG